MTNRFTWPIRVLALLVLAASAGVALAMIRARAPELLVQRTASIMATPISAAVGPEHAASIDRVFEVFRGVDERMSEWKSSSPLAAVNAAAGSHPVTVPDDLRAVIRRAIGVAVLTDGAFDPSWAALWGVWDFRAETPSVPDAALIEERRALVDYTRIEIDDDAGTVFLPRAGMKVGLGAIAKGYALESAAARLRADGVVDFLVTAGGQVMAGGHRPGHESWRIGIRDPRGAPDEMFAILKAHDVSVSTSGDYERAFELDGKRYHHVLDPRTGWPSLGVRSATVVSADPTLADALSTALMILPVDRGLEIVDRLDGSEALIVTDTGTVRMTAGFRVYVESLHDPIP